MYQLVLYAQDFIPIIYHCSQLFHNGAIFWMHVVCLKEVYSCIFIRMGHDIWATICVRVTWNVYKSKRRDASYMQELCHPFYREDIHLQETISWWFHTCQKTVGKISKNLVQVQAPLRL